MSKVMNISAITTLLLILTATTGGNESSLVQNTCKSTPNYDLCVKVLSADPRSSQGDMTTLAIILVDNVKSHSEEASSTIKNLEKTRPDLKKALDDCAYQYDKMILGICVPEAYEALTKGNPKFAEDAVVCSSGCAETCENDFSKGKSPLNPLNKLVQDLSDVARAVIRNLL